PDDAADRDVIDPERPDDPGEADEPEGGEGADEAFEIGAEISEPGSLLCRFVWAARYAPGRCHDTHGVVSHSRNQPSRTQWPSTQILTSSGKADPNRISPTSEACMRVKSPIRILYGNQRSRADR